MSERQPVPPELPPEERAHALMQAAWWGIVAEDYEEIREYAQRQRSYYLGLIGMGHENSPE